MEVILNSCKNCPSCPHGPCLLFERYASDGSRTGRRFFACSACRERSECSFFHWADEEMSERKKALWEKIKLEKKPPFSHEDHLKRLQIFKSLPVAERKYCRTCSLLVLEQSEEHLNHDILENVSSQHLVKPSLLFTIHENKKVEAQYFFTEETIHFLVSQLKNLRFSKFVCIGAPKIHEFILTNHEKDGLSSLFMDIDHRYMQFFGPDQFCHYNMFNNYFFGGKECKKIFKKFLYEKPDEKVVIIIDPPFGGLIDAISHTLKTISKWWQNKNHKTEENVTILWIFPYFHEGRILKNLPNMKMMDYKVEYANHKKFKNTKSPVRIFTNIDLSKFVLPSELGYRFCGECERYVSEENQHCLKCNSCTTKHGKTYHHCDDCGQCVKASYVHCQKCHKCGLFSSDFVKVCKDCESNNEENGVQPLSKCFKCNGIGHKRQNCPERNLRHYKKRRKQRK